MSTTPEEDAEKQSVQAPSGKGEDKTGDARRNFLRLSLTLGLVLVVGGIASVVRSLISPSFSPPNPPAPGTSTQTVTSTVTVGTSGGSSSASASSSSTSSISSPFPRVLAANISDLAGGQTVTFNYPLEETPNLLAKLGQKADGGVGPDGDIVAFSQICQHLGCVFGYVPSGASPKCDNTYKATGPVGYCCCHGSVYDLTDGAKVLAGPAPRPQPQVTLEFDSTTGDIYAVGMGPPTIFGHDTGSNNVLNDLLGGTPVS